MLLVRMPTVTLCTVTYNRARLLPLLEQCILDQTYPRELLEWVIVDDSDKGQPEFHPQEGTGLKCKYVTVSKKLILGKKRNLSHRFCSGDIIVYMDDDEYYPPTRVEHAVNRLEESDCEVAGATNLPILVIPERQLWMAGPYGDNHATANTFAFKKTLLSQTCYEDDARHAEEKHFLRGYTFPMVQLDPQKTIICFGHHRNTFDKRRLIANGANPRMRRLPQEEWETWISSDLVDKYQAAHEMSLQVKSTTSLDASEESLSVDRRTDDLLLVCSPPGSGELRIKDSLVRLGALEISGNRDAEGVIAPYLLNLKTLELSQSAPNRRAMLKEFRDQIIRFRHNNPTAMLILREPYGAPLINSLRDFFGLKLIVCLRPLPEICDANIRKDGEGAVGAGIIHRLYGHLFSVITNTQIPFHMVRYHDLLNDPDRSIRDLVKFAGLAPPNPLLHEASQWLAGQSTHA